VRVVCYAAIVTIKGLFVLAFVVEFEVGYNLFMHKTQPQKLFFFFFLAF